MSIDDQKLSQLYQRLANEQPSRQLDQKIIDQAHIQPSRKKYIAARAPFSIAASIAIAGLLFISFPEYYQLSPPHSEEQIPLPQSIEPTLGKLPPQRTAKPMRLEAQTQGLSKSINDPALTIKVAGLKASVQLKQQKETPLTAIQQQQLDIIDKLVISDPVQAIKLLQQLQQKYPELVLAKRYQLLLNK